MHAIHTIGHSTRSAEELVALLRGAGIELVVDVRRFPASRRHPQFSRDRLAATLAGAGVDYVHMEALGGRRPVADDSPNVGLRNASFRGYADHMGTSEFRCALQHLQQLAARRTVAILCAEAVPWRCHRNLIADALVAHGHEVRHIVSDAPTLAHELNPHAHVGADGSLLYRGERRQLDLLD